MEAKMWADSQITGKSTSTAGRGRTGLGSSEDQQAADGEILPAEDRSLSHWPVLQVDEEQVHGQCRRCPHRTDACEYLFKCCPHWKRQQNILWAKVRKQNGRSI